MTIGRRDTDSYGVFPADGADLVRRLEEGHTIRQVTDWYEQRYGESVEIEDLIEALDELGFISAADEEPVEAHPPKWRRPRRSACHVLMGIRESGRVAR